MEEELGNLSIIDKKENPFQAQEDESTLKEDYKLCLVRSYLTASVMYFPSMRNIVANLWHPIRGGFLDYDTKMVLSSMKRLMKIRVSLDMGKFLLAAGNGGAIQDNIWLGYIVKSPIEKRGSND
ncbi:hypothetical protein Golax_004993 [Gossypium laxum]|uniref:Uncharacterized protein n=1 Tax=Gossypium laxum TaxID=34288 RepID=A0A7J8ZZE3_9ROSI|nr:hypothetical protein [Gossypium laxum]